MSEKVYVIQHLGCANCAAKMEARINALPQVQEATITFATQQLRVTADDPDRLLPQLQKIVSSIEADAIIRPQAGTHPSPAPAEDGGRSHSGHDHHTAQAPLWHLLLGAVLFVLGLVLNRLNLPGLAAYIAAYLLLGRQVLTTAGKNLLKGHVFDENFLMTLATLGAFAIREFPEAVGIMLFYRVGAFFEEKAVARTRSQIMAAADLRSQTVQRLHGTHAHTIPVEQAQVGDLLLVRPGDRIPLDGVVVSGESRIDTAPITGEPVPVSVGIGAAVISGCVNTTGLLTVRVEKELSESMVTRILHAVETAAAGKPKIDRFITRFSRIYTPTVVGIALVTALIPPLITGNWNYWVYTALSFLVMSCPCALVLSVPLAFFSGIGAGCKKGILFKGGSSIEALAGIKAVALDKTGTITKGDFRVQQVTGPKNLLTLCASCEQNSTHPIAVSITAAARERGLELLTPEELEEIPGHGIRAVFNEKTVLCGNEKLLTRFGVHVPDAGVNRVLVAEGGRYLGYILVSDTLKQDASATVAQLKTTGLTIALLTGDSAENAQSIAEKTGITQIYARLLPEEKLSVLQALRTNFGPVLFVGDGINDAPVLAGADVGVAMGSGADAAMEAADIVFLSSKMQSIADALQLARATRRIAWQNVVFALGIKAVVMVLGLLGFASMWMAVFADSGVAMLCVLNSIRLLYRKQ